MNLVANERAGIHGGSIRVFVTDFNEMPPEHPEVIAVTMQRLSRISLCEQVHKERREYFHEFLCAGNILVLEAPC
jgi:broad specificity phosphatase PhoE